MSDEREEFEAARAAGLKARHETRVERAREREAISELCESVATHMSSVAGIYYVPQTSTDEAYDKLARAAVDVARPAIRRQVAEEIALWILDYRGPDRSPASPAWWAGYAEAQQDCAQIAREIGAKETS